MFPRSPDVFRSLERAMLGALGELGRDLLALVWPTECVGCGAPDRDLCRGCRDLMRAPSRASRGELGLSVGSQRGSRGRSLDVPRARLEAGGRVRDGLGSGGRDGLGPHGCDGPGVGGCDGPGARAGPSEPSGPAAFPLRMRSPSPVYLSVPLYAAGPYEGVPRAVLVAQKHQGRAGFSRELGRRILDPLRAALDHAERPERPLIVCVPSRRARVRERGYRHVELIVRAALRASDVARGTSIARETGPKRVLRPLIGRTAQVGLNADERDRNARLIAVRRSWWRRVRGREVVVVDDVVTTGATITAACEVLVAAGARVVAAVALCVVERRDTRGSEKSEPK